MKKKINQYTENIEKLLEEKTKEIQDSQLMLLQSEKMASIGQLAAGVAHEINNPIGFISSNLNTLDEYLRDIKRLMEKCQKISFLKDEKKKCFLRR